MAIPSPWVEPEPSTVEAESASNGARERERDHAGAGEYTPKIDDATDDNLVPFPGATTEIAQRDKPGWPAKLGDASKVWFSDTARTTAEVFDGTVLKARPPSIRDRVTRIRRATWAGDLDGLRKAGQVASIPPLILYTLIQAVAWVCAPLRFYLAISLVIVIVVLAI